MTVLVTDTTLSEVHRALIASGMRTQDILPIAEELDEVGFSSLEIGDDASFDVGVYFSNEDPFGSLRALREKVKKTPLQISLRGKSRGGTRNYPDDLIQEFIQLSVKNGIGVFRIFDASNDIRNIEMTIQIVKKSGAHVQGTICYATSPVHNAPFFSGMAVELEKLGCDSVCIMDMAGLISPANISDFVNTIKSNVHIPLGLHSRNSRGIAPISYYAAAATGVDFLDTAFATFAWRTSLPPTEGMVAALKGTLYETGLDLQKIYEISEHFFALKEKYRQLLTPEVARQSTNRFSYQIPEDILSDLMSQLRERNALTKLDEVREEISRVRADLSTPRVESPKEFRVEIDGEVFDLKISSIMGKPVEEENLKGTVEVAKGSIVSPMPGVVISLAVKVGDRVKEGDLVATIEAMKMHYEVYAIYNGVVKAVLSSEGDMVDTETVLMVVEPDNE